MERRRESGGYVFPGPRHTDWHALEVTASDGMLDVYSRESHDGGVNTLSSKALIVEDVQKFCENPRLKLLRVSFHVYPSTVFYPYHSVWEKLRGELRKSTSLEYLELSGASIYPGWIRGLAIMLSSQSSLRGLKLDLGDGQDENWTDPHGAKDLVKAAINMKTLEILDVCMPWTDLGRNALIMLMASLTGDEQANTSLRSLTMEVRWHRSSERDEDLTALVECFVSMLETNTTLTTITIPNFVRSEDALIGVLNALYLNQSVSNIILCAERASGFLPKLVHVRWEEEVFASLLRLIKFRNEHGNGLANVDVRGTGLEKPEYAVPIEAGLKRKYSTDATAANVFVRPTSCRVFICGFPEAGKTTLRKKVEYILHERAMMSHLVYSLSKRVDMRHKRVSKRTAGVEVATACTPSVELSMWDMGGQDEFHAFHDLVIPNLSDYGSATLFILVCSVASTVETTNKTKAKSTKVIAFELQYWLHFLSSNMPLSKNRKSHVIMVFTHVDALRESMDVKRHVKDPLEHVKGLFAESFQFGSTEYFVDSNSTKMVEPFVTRVVKEAEVVLAKVPNIYRACLDMKGEISEWKKNHPNETFMEWKDFVDVCRQTPLLKAMGESDRELVQDICKTIASDLNEGGHVLYFEGLDVIVVNPNWFGTRIIGSILSIDHKCVDPNTREAVTNEKGYIERARLVSVLENSFDDGKGGVKRGGGMTGRMDVDVLVRVLKKMNLCYEEHVGDSGDKQWRAIFVPSTLRDEGGLAHQGRRKLRWSAMGCSSRQTTTYIGRRLECEDSVRTSFTAGFFPRLQVVLERRFGLLRTFRLEKNLVVFMEDGMQVLVEYSGDLGGEDIANGFIDIMVQSLKSHARAVQFAKEEVMKPLRHLCASPAFGCQGVTLLESILRPLCVEQLWICRDRREQAVKERELIASVLAKQDFEGYMHHWVAHGGDHGGDEACTLLGEVVWEAEIVSTRVAKMVELASDMMQDQDAGTTVSKEMEEVGEEEQQQITSLESLYQMLRQDMRRERDTVVERVNRHMDKTVEPIYNMQCKVLKEISKNIDRVIDHAVHMLQRQVPRYVYVTRQDLGSTERLISSLVPGLKSVQLHLMCEHKGNIHAVDGQEGEPLHLESETLRGLRPYVVWGLRIITMLMKVSAHTAAGLGSMVPDLEKSLLRGVASFIPHVPSDVLGKEGTPSKQVELMKLSNYFGESEKRMAEQWLVNFLHGMDIEAKFGLQRIRYKDGSNDMAWVCKSHVEEGRRTSLLESCPI